MRSRPDNVFEALARQFLAQYPALPHEWRTIPSVMSGDRIDLVCAPGSDIEVWATLRPGSIAVGSGTGHMDFERFGRKLSDEELAMQALDHFKSLLVKRQLIPAIRQGNET